jgi:hypothetical protein
MEYLTDEQWYAGFGWDEAHIKPVTDAIQRYILAYRNYEKADSTSNAHIKEKPRLDKARPFSYR